MSVQISTDYDSWDVSNRMYRRVVEFALEVGSRLATPNERAWVERLAAYYEKHGYGGQTSSIEQFAPTPEEMQFWAYTLREVAEGIFRREIGNQENEDWQVDTLWACNDLSRLLTWESDRLQARTPDGAQASDPRKSEGEVYYQLQNDIRRLIAKLIDIGERLT